MGERHPLRAAPAEHLLRLRGLEGAKRRAPPPRPGLGLDQRPGLKPAQQPLGTDTGQRAQRPGRVGQRVDRRRQGPKRGDLEHAAREAMQGLEQAIESEAQAQAICMQTKDFERAYRAFVAKERPSFEGD